MKVFISSVISGMEEFREAARLAVETLGDKPVMAEDLAAQPSSSQRACFREVREADLFVLILGRRYGQIQPSGFSATHEEYREAQKDKPILAFVQEGVERDKELTAFVEEVESWNTGVFRQRFTTTEDLKTAVIKALHDYHIGVASGPVDQAALTERAISLLPTEDRNYSSSNITLAISLAGGPRRQILRPAEIESRTLANELQKEGMFGANKIFDSSEGIDRKIAGTSLILFQKSGASFSIDEMGDVFVTLVLGDGQSSGFSLPALIEEDISERLSVGFGFCSWALDLKDPNHRLTHLAIAAKICGGSIWTWRTREEHKARPNQVSGFSNEEHEPVTNFRKRAAIRNDADKLVEDILIRLRRQWKPAR